MGDDQHLFGDDTSSRSHAEYLRAIEAVVLVAHEPVPPELLAQLLERSITDIERWCHELAAGYEAEDRGFQLVRVAGGYRYQTPRPDPLRRALPAPRPAGPTVRRGARDAGHRRLQAADLAGPDRLDPRRRPRRRAAHAAGSGPDRRRRARRRPGPGRAVRHDGGVPREARSGHPWTSCRRSPTSSPVPTWSRPSRPGCGSPMADRPDPPRGERLQKVLASRGWGSRRVCEELIAAGRVTVNGEVAVLGRRVEPDQDLVEVDGAPVGTRPGLVHYLLNKPAGVVTTAKRPAGPTDRGRARAGRRRGCSRSGGSTPTPRACSLLTNDGELANRVAHPRHGVEKEYLATVDAARRAGQCRGDPPAARRRRAGRRTDGPGQGVPAQPRRAADHDPRGSQPPGAPDVRGRRPSGDPPRAHPHRPAARLPPRPRHLAAPRRRRGAPPRPRRCSVLRLGQPPLIGAVAAGTMRPRGRADARPT